MGAQGVGVGNRSPSTQLQPGAAARVPGQRLTSLPTPGTCLCACLVDFFSGCFRPPGLGNPQDIATTRGQALKCVPPP